MRYTYSRWDGTLDVAGLDPDELLDALADDLLTDADVAGAMQRVVRWGLQRGGEQTAPGLQWLLQRLRNQRQQELDRYSLGSVLEEIAEQLDDIIRLEEEEIEKRRLSASEADDSVRRALEEITRRKQAFLDALPSAPASQIDELHDYEFLNDVARTQFEGLTDRLQRQVLKSHFHHIQQSLRDMAGAALDELKSMVRDLNAMIQDRRAGDDPDFRRFMDNHGRFFPSTASFDQLLEDLQAQTRDMESLYQSMSPDMRRSLQDLLNSATRDQELRTYLAAIAEALPELLPARPRPSDYPFSGDTSLTLEEALRLMRRLHHLDELERQTRLAHETGDLRSLDADSIRPLLGDDAARVVEQLQDLTNVLERAGYVETQGDSFTLTARGIRRIGEKALRDIFQHLQRDAFGQHAVARQGIGADRSEDTKAYEFGDPFLLDLSGTLMQAALRHGEGMPLALHVSDFRVYRTEYLTRSSTVLLLDMSRSMPLRGCFVAAKKVAFALNSLIRTQFPRDSLYIVGFSDYARLLRPETLHQITWGDYVYGTNMQHGLILARRLLARHKGANKQIILITDGEPTAHFEGDRVQFSYPPTFRTFQETLREVKRCTAEGIVINTFMLERSHYLADFVGQLTRINRGRAFFATPDRLGDYILIDYVASKRNGVNTRVHSA